jgi:cytochrome oxidase Cu insertion factor (SCO1/SenC/PrrC family)
MRRPSSKQRRLVILLLVLITFSLAYYAGVTQKRPQRLPAIDGVLINPPLPLSPIELLNQHEQLFSLNDMQGHWNLLMLDPFPTPGKKTASDALRRLIQVHNRLAAKPDIQQQIHYLYISPGGLGDKALSFASLSDNIQTLHGDKAQINKAFEALGGDTDHEPYTLYLIGPETKLYALFTQNSNAVTIAEDLNNLISALR